MADAAVVERGVLTAQDEVWDAAVRQAEVIGPLAAKRTVGLADADEAAAMLGMSRRQVYVLVGRWRAGEGVVSDLLPGRSSGGRGGGGDRCVSRCVVGLVVTLEAPSATSVGLCLAHAATDKRPWLERLGVEATWPMSGKPGELYLDNAAEFKSEALRRGCDQHGIKLRYRPPGQPHFGGIIERLIGTMMREVHELPGTTFSNTTERGSYDSDKKAALTVRELQCWLALAVASYHGQVHEGVGRTPAGVWATRPPGPSW